MRRLLLASVLLAACIDVDSLDRCARADCQEGVPCISEVRAGWTHTCARRVDGSVWCWGNNIANMLSDPDVSLVMRPEPAPVDATVSFDTIASGDSFTCGVVSGAGTAACWGYNNEGQLGDNQAPFTTAPAEVVGLADARQIAAGEEHACARRADGTVACWGANDHGQLGDGSLADQLTPVAVASLGDVVEIALGYTHSCALSSEGQVFCWGMNTNGQLGDGTQEDRGSAGPAVVIANVVHIGAGFHHTCAVRRDGTLWCWGLNNLGQLGDGTTEDRSLPVRAGSLTGVVAVSMSGYPTIGPLAHTCALREGGEVWCWGSNMFGELGDDTSVNRLSPTRVASLFAAVALGVGAKHSCAIRRDGTLWCWGANDRGQLGTGHFTEAHLPAATLLTCP